jgi:hypothetical protein
LSGRPRQFVVFDNKEVAQQSLLAVASFVGFRERFLPRIALPMHDEQDIFADSYGVAFLAILQIHSPMLDGGFYSPALPGLVKRIFVGHGGIVFRARWETRALLLGGAATVKKFRKILGCAAKKVLPM